MRFLLPLSILLTLGLSAGAAPLRLALNWKAEPQFGGFYEAARQGEFKKRHLEVEILQGGSGTPTIQMLAHAQVPYAIVGAEELLLSRERTPENPLVAVFAVYQTYPCMIMTHAERNFKNLGEVFQHEGHLAVQAGLPYFDFLKHKYPAPWKVQVVPYAGGIGLFLQDPHLSQQGFVTSEPLLAQKAGAAVRIFRLADEGFNPYTTVLAVRQDYLQKHPQEVRDFVAAVRVGWQDYLKDPAPANRDMARLNPAMDAATFSASAKAQEELIRPAGKKAEALGKMSSARWEKLSRQMNELGLIHKIPAAKDLYKNLD